jgi:hypothetical protein
MNERAKALGELLGNDAELQSVAVEYGFRIADTERFVATVKPPGWPSSRGSRRWSTRRRSRSWPR